MFISNITDFPSPQWLGSMEYSNSERGQSIDMLQFDAVEIRKQEKKNTESIKELLPIGRREKKKKKGRDQQRMGKVSFNAKLNQLQKCARNLISTFLRFVFFPGSFNVKTTVTHL